MFIFQNFIILIINKMKGNKKIILQVAFSLLTIVLLMIKEYKFTESYIDYFFILIGIIASLIILFSKNNNLLDIAHFLYCGVFVVGVSLCSKNECMLFLNSVMILNIILSRFYYKKCLLNEKQQYKGQFRDINKKMKLNWDIIFPSMFLLSYLNI